MRAGRRHSELRQGGEANDRGATAILVGLLLVVLLGFAALGVDLGALWSDKKQLQNGADAGALAIAQACAGGNCGAYNATATSLASQNKLDANATVESVALDTGAATVTVTTVSTRRHWFAPVIGQSSSLVRSRATAAWSNGGASTLPIAFSLCAFWLQTSGTYGAPPDTSKTYTLTLKSKDDAEDFTNPPVSCAGVTNAAHNEVSGGFGWLDPTSTSPCEAKINSAGNVGSDPGASQPCNLDLEGLKNRVVLVPIFDRAGGSGSNAWYHIMAFAAFRVTAFCLPQGEFNVGTCNASVHPDSGRRILGKFVTWVTLDSASSGGTTPDMGIRFVKLTN